MAEPYWGEFTLSDVGALYRSLVKEDVSSEVGAIGTNLQSVREDEKVQRNISRLAEILEFPSFKVLVFLFHFWRLPVPKFGSNQTLLDSKLVNPLPGPLKTVLRTMKSEVAKANSTRIDGEGPWTVQDTRMQRTRRMRHDRVCDIVMGLSGIWSPLSDKVS